MSAVRSSSLATIKHLPFPLSHPPLPCTAVYRGLYFGMYDSFKPLLGDLQDNFLANFALGWGITIA